MTWFIEAWQPDDGLTFLSSRAPDGTVQEVVFVGAPTFEAIPVRDLATAWWATRGSFQELTFDLPPQSSGGSGATGGGTVGGAAFPEVAFPTLAHAVTLLQSIYVLGPLSEPPPLGLGPVAPQSPLSPSGASAALAAYQQITRDLSRLTSASDREAVAHGLDALASQVWYQDLLRSILTESLARMPTTSATSLPADERRTAFALLLARTGLWDEPAHLLRDWTGAARRGGQAPPAELASGHFARLTKADESVAVHGTNGLLLQVPCAVALPAPYKRGLWSLGHRLCAAAADRKYVRSLPDIQAIAVVHASAWTLAAGAGGTTPEPRLARVGCARRAAHWLALNLAGDSLAEVPAAEALIAAVVEARARRHEEALQAVEEAQRKAEQARQMAARARAAEQEARRAEERRAAAAERARVEREAAARERERDREREREEEREQHQHVHHSAPLYRS